MTDTPEQERWIKSISVRVTPPGLKDNTADVDRLLKEIEKVLGSGEVTIDLPLARRIPSLLREHHYHVEAILYQGLSSWHLLDLVPPGQTGSVYGLAVDLGTSVIAVRLLDLVTGEVKEEMSFLNPQIQVGPDILTRIHYAGQESGLRSLQLSLIQRLNQEIHSLAERWGISNKNIMGQE